MTTGTIPAEIETLSAPLEITMAMMQNAGLQELYYVAHDDADYRLGEGLRGFRANSNRNDNLRLLVNGEPVEVPYPLNNEAEVHWSCGKNFLDHGDMTIWFKDGSYFTSSPWRFDGVSGHNAHDGDIVAPMPGKVTAVEVSQSEKVSKGQRLLTLEAMKMEHALTAPFDGTVAELNVAPGQQVAVEASLARIEPTAG